MSAWQSEPDGEGLWWRDGGDGPALCYVHVQPFGVDGAHEIARASRWHVTTPCDGVQWARCEPPPSDAPRCSVTHHTGCACHEARRDAVEARLRRELAHEVGRAVPEAQAAVARSREAARRVRLATAAEILDMLARGLTREDIAAEYAVGCGGEP